MKYLLKSEQDTQNLGKTFGEKSKGGEIFLLCGDLGSGKTQFVKGLAEGLGIIEPITSPTFTYEKIYTSPKELTLYHFDLYREQILDPDIKSLMEEAFGDPKGVVAVEWAEYGKASWPKDYILVEFKWISENEREVEIK